MNHSSTPDTDSIGEVLYIARAYALRTGQSDLHDALNGIESKARETLAEEGPTEHMNITANVGIVASALMLHSVVDGPDAKRDLLATVSCMTKVWVHGGSQA